MPNTNLQRINHFVVLVLENRSFDHLFGSLQNQNSQIAGFPDSAFCNPAAADTAAASLKPTRATRYTMPFDPGHEFEDIQIQLYGQQAGPARAAKAPLAVAPMAGFVCSANAAAAAADRPRAASRVLDYFEAAQIPVLSTLAREFALFNFWHASLPGPTWPNRFFFHAASSDGLTASPGDEAIVQGYTFAHGTIYQRLGAAGWRIYHDGLPQSAGINSLRGEYLDPLTRNFRQMSHFNADVAASDLPAYTFIEPAYDTGHNYQHGNSMHPLNDLRAGEKLLKQVYEALRNSPLWADTMLIVTFDEHGGFFDHQPPPAAVPPGTPQTYASPGVNFDFGSLGVRVPALAISAYTQANTVIGTEPNDSALPFDHTSILATLNARFTLEHLTARDKAARTLAPALNLATPRLAEDSAPTRLPEPVADSWFAHLRRWLTPTPRPARDDAIPSSNQRTFLALALACDLHTAEPARHPAIRQRHQAIRTAREAARYIEEVERGVLARRT